MVDGYSKNVDDYMSVLFTAHIHKMYTCLVIYKSSCYTSSTSSFYHYTQATDLVVHFSAQSLCCAVVIQRVHRVIYSGATTDVGFDIDSNSIVSYDVACPFTSHTGALYC